jgi:hypothetical protein
VSLSAMIVVGVLNVAPPSVEVLAWMAARVERLA